MPLAVVARVEISRGHGRLAHITDRSRIDPRSETAHANSLGGEFLGLCDPTLHAAGQSHLLADLVRGLGPERGDLPIVEDAEIVQLLFDRGRYVGELLEIVGDPTGAGKHLVARAVGRGW